MCGVYENAVHALLTFFGAALQASPRGSSRIYRTAVAASSRRVEVVQGVCRQPHGVVDVSV